MNIRNVYDTVIRKHITDNTSQITGRCNNIKYVDKILIKLHWARAFESGAENGAERAENRAKQSAERTLLSAVIIQANAAVTPYRLWNDLKCIEWDDKPCSIHQACCDKLIERKYFCQMIRYRTPFLHNAAWTFTWNSKIATFSQKTWLITVLIFMYKMLHNSPTSIFHSRNFTGVIPRTHVKGKGREREKEEGSGEDGGEGKGCVVAVGEWTPLIIRSDCNFCSFNGVT